MYSERYSPHREEQLCKKSMAEKFALANNQGFIFYYLNLYDIKKKISQRWLYGKAKFSAIGFLLKVVPLDAESISHYKCDMIGPHFSIGSPLAKWPSK